MIPEAVDDPWPRRCELAGAAIVATIVVWTAARAWAQWDISSNITFNSIGSIEQERSPTSNRLRMLANVVDPTVAVLLLVGFFITVADAVATGTAESRRRLGTITVTAVGVTGLVFTVSGLVSLWDLLANPERNLVFSIAVARVERLTVAGLGMTSLWLAASAAADAIGLDAAAEIDADEESADVDEPYFLD